MNTLHHASAVFAVSAGLMMPPPSQAEAMPLAHADSYSTTQDAQGNPDKSIEAHLTLTKLQHVAILRFSGRVTAQTMFEQPNCTATVGVDAKKGDRYIALTPALGGCATSTDQEANPTMVTSFSFAAPSVIVTKAIRQRATRLKQHGYDITLRGDSPAGTLITEAPAL